MAGRCRPRPCAASTGSCSPRSRRRSAGETALAAGCGLVADPWLFTAQPDGSTPWYPDAVYTWWRRIRRTAGVSGVRFHDLRNYNATQLLATGVDVRTVAGRLGHADPSITLRVYSHFLLERDRDAAEAIARLLGSK